MYTVFVQVFILYNTNLYFDFPSNSNCNWKMTPWAWGGIVNTKLARPRDIRSNSPHFFSSCRRSKIFDSAVAPSSLCQPWPTGESPGACADAGRAARPGRARGYPGRAASLAHRPRLTRRHCAAMGCRKSRTNPKQRGGWGGALVAERSGSRWCVGLAPRAPHSSRDRPPPASPPPSSLFVQLWPQRYQATIAFHVTREPTQRCGGTKPCVCDCVCVCRRAGFSLRRAVV